MPGVSCFKAYDIRGKVGVDLDEDLAWRLGRAVAARLGPGSVVVGRDMRLSSAPLAEALARGLCDAGGSVHDLGLCGTEEVYFATDHLRAGAGIMVTASHNPAEYNGFKLVAEGARPLTEAEFRGIEVDVAGPGRPASVRGRGTFRRADTRAAYVDRICSFVDPGALGPLHLVSNAGNGAAGPTFDEIVDALAARGAPIRVTRVNHDPDGRFPNGVPNPLLPENHAATGDHVRAHAADLGVAWDGDFDRCFFFDEAGAFVAGEHAVALIARTVLEGEPGARIVHDPRVVRNTDRIVRAGGGTPILARTGHAYMKTAMRAHDAAYGGEMSAHHYFRDFMYCDSGMIPMLMVLSLLSRAGQTLGGLVEEMRTRYPSSGELNFRVPDTRRAMEAIEERYGRGARVSHPDGLCVETDAWRFNLRASNTEPLIRLNVETQGDPQLLKDLVDRLSADIGARL